MALRLCQLKAFLPDGNEISQDTVKLAMESFKNIPMEHIYNYIRSAVEY